MLLIGSHVSFDKKQLLGATEEAISYGANTFMFYTGAPVNTTRTPINDQLTLNAYELMKDKIVLESVICHAPYIVNLANRQDPDKFNFSVNFLKQEVARCEQMNIKYLVIHPGNAVGISKETGLKNIIDGLNLIIYPDMTLTILIESMAGKGTECGNSIEELKIIIDNVKLSEHLGVCLDTCHLHDAGYDLSNFDTYLDKFDQQIGISYIKCLHVNDSKNESGSHKDRHANIGFGNIGFDNLMKVIYHEKLKNIPKILETPYVGDYDEDKNRLYSPYKHEIAMIKAQKFNPELLNEIRKYYQK